MADEVTVVLFGNADLSTSNDGAGQRGTEQVSVLVDGVALDGGEGQLLDQFPLQVEDDHLLGTKSHSLLLDGRPVLILADVGQEADDSVTLCVPV